LNLRAIGGPCGCYWKQQGERIVSKLNFDKQPAKWRGRSFSAGKAGASPISEKREGKIQGLTCCRERVYHRPARPAKGVKGGELLSKTSPQELCGKIGKRKITLGERGELREKQKLEL